MATTMEEIRQLQQQLFEAQQGKSVARLTDSNVVELVQLLLQRELVTLHLSGQGYITPKQLANEIKDQLLLSGGRISLAELHAAINTDIGIIEDRVEKMCEENPPSADPRTPGVVLEDGQLIADYYMDDIAAEVNTEHDRGALQLLLGLSGRGDAPPHGQHDRRPDAARRGGRRLHLCLRRPPLRTAARRVLRGDSPRLGHQDAQEHGVPGARLQRRASGPEMHAL
jgi:hypothetical protein